MAQSKNDTENFFDRDYFNMPFDDSNSNVRADRGERLDRGGAGGRHDKKGGGGRRDSDSHDVTAAAAAAVAAANVLSGEQGFSAYVNPQTMALSGQNAGLLQQAPGYLQGTGPLAYGK